MLSEKWNSLYSSQASGNLAGKSYWVTNHPFSNIPFNHSESSDLNDQMYGNEPGTFGNLSVPNFAIIGKGGIVYFNGYPGTLDEILGPLNEAIASFEDENTVVITTPLNDENIEIGKTINIDLSNLFSNDSGNPIQKTVKSNTNSAILSTNIVGDTLKVTTTQTAGETILTIKGSTSSSFAIDKFKITVEDVNSEIILYENFEVPDNRWTYEDQITGWRYGNIETLNAPQNPDSVCIYWGFNSGDGYFLGTHSELAEHWFGSGTKVHGYAISPVLDLNNVINMRVNYDYCFLSDGSSTYANVLRLLYRTSENGNWIKIKEYGDVNYQVVQREFTTESNINIPVGAQTLTTQFAFEYDDYGNDSYGAGIDNFELWGTVKLGINTNNNISKDCILNQNYPNPFNPETTIGFNLTKDMSVKLNIFNSKGEMVRNLINKKLNKGMHSINFDAKNLNSGVYYYTIETKHSKTTKKMLLIK